MYAFFPWACGPRAYISGKAFMPVLQLLHMPDYTSNRSKLQNQPPVVSYTFKLSSLVWQAQMAILALARTWFDKLCISGALVCGLF